jgi:hypothetical protein
MTEACRLCSFQVRDDHGVPDSSARDVILSLAISQLVNVYPLIRTLRTTRCKARFILFVDTLAVERYSSRFAELRTCGVQFINLGPNPTDSLPRDLLRQVCYHRFLAVNRFAIDRVLVIDLFDTVFQSDPFTSSFLRDRVYYSTETALIRTDLQNRRWVRTYASNSASIFPGAAVPDIDVIFENPILNGGVMAGGLGPFIRHLEMMERMADRKSLMPFGTDQGFLNFFVYGGFADFPFQVDPENATFLGTIGLSKGRRPSSGSKLGEFCGSGKVYSVLHQIDRFSDLYEAILEACPNTDPPFPDYISCRYCKRSGQVLAKRPLEQR